MSRRIVVGIWVAVISVSIPANRAHAQKMYWVEKGGDIVGFADRDGANRGSFAIGSNPVAIAVDALNGHVYWSEVGTDKLRRADVDGSNMVDIVTSVDALAIALDVYRGKIYWLIDDGLGGLSKVRRANLDGSSIEDVVVTATAVFPLGVALDVQQDKVYWTEFNTAKVMSASLDGTQVETVVTSSGLLTGIAVDTTNGKVYWAACLGPIRRANLDGTNVETVIPQVDFPCPIGISLDVSDGKLYWADENGAIRRANLDGSGITDLVTGGMSSPEHIALDELPEIPVGGGVSFTANSQFGEDRTHCVAWGDYNADGFVDLAVGNGGPNKLYTSDTLGGFVESSPFGGLETIGIVWADFDNDGDLDMTVGNRNLGPNYLYVNDGAGAFSRTQPFGAHQTAALAWGDFDRDGDLDLAVGNGLLGFSGQNYLYVNQGSGTFEAREEFGALQTTSLVWCDFDGDGDLDLAVGNGGLDGPQQNYLYINNGDETFSGRAEFGEFDTATVACADADNDGDLDLAVGNFANGQNALYVNDGVANFTFVAAFGARPTVTISWADVDHDGLLDVAVGNGVFVSAVQNYLYLNNGDTTFVEAAEFGLGSTLNIAWGDFDNDGDLDAAVGNARLPPSNALYENNLDDSAYLHLRLVGRFHAMGLGYSNRDGVGAKVYLYPPGALGDNAQLLGFREVSAHGGFSPQNQMGAMFGVPGQATVDLRIVWPGSDAQNILQELVDVSVGQKLTVEEEGEFAVA